MAGNDSDRIVPRDCLIFEWTAQKANESNPLFSEDFLRWLDSIKIYAKETKIKLLNLQARGLVPKDIETLLISLHDCPVTELDLGDNNLEHGIEELSKILAKTKLKKLNINDCEMLDEDLLVLFELLKEMGVTELDVSSNMIELEANEMNEIVSHLLKSQLRTLNISMNYFTNMTGVQFLVEKLPNTSLTHLNLSATGFSYKNVLNSLFSLLPETCISDLSLSSNGIQDEELIELSRNLQNCKLEKLNLSMNDITDAGINYLADGLAHSKLIDLNLNGNNISGENNLFLHFKNTKIQVLDLGSNQIVSQEMFCFLDFLKETAITSLDISHCQLGDTIGRELLGNLESSNLTKLNVSGNHLQLSSISELVHVVSKTNITDIDLSNNDLPMEAFIALGDCLKESKLKNIDVSMNCDPQAGVGLYYLLEQTKKSQVITLGISGLNIFSCSGEPLSKILPNTTFTCLDLSQNQINDRCFTSLAWSLKFTAITHLNLSRNNISDEGLISMTKCLKETQLVDLDISFNLITSRGAKILAECLKGTNLLSLNLKGNQIEDDGLQTFANHIEDTFITSLDLSRNPVSRILLIDKILWQNRLSAHRLVTFFNTIVRKSSEGNLIFNPDVSSVNVSKLLKECFLFYKTVCEQSCALHVLAQDESVSSSKLELSAYLLDEFPRQLITFIQLNFRSDLTNCVSFLQKADELGLDKIVKLLLANRALFAMGETKNDFHPYFSKILLKHK